MFEWDSRSEAWQARKHSTTIRRSRKGGDNSRTYRRGQAPVTGSPVASGGAWADLVGTDVALAMQSDLRGAHRLILGTAGLDLTRLVDRYADVLGVEALIGTEAMVAHQMFDVRKASPGADLADLIAVTAHRDDLTSWADTQAARKAFGVPQVIENKLAWPARMTAGTARSRKSESTIAGPRVPDSKGVLRRTGALYGAEFVRTGRRYVTVTRTHVADRHGWVTMPRRSWISTPGYGGPYLYGTRAGWAPVAGHWHVTPGVKTVVDHRGRPIIVAHLDVEADPTTDDRQRVFIGHRSVVRGAARKVGIKDVRHLGAFHLSEAVMVPAFARLIEPATLATVTFPSGTYGTVSRSAGGRWSISLDVEGRKVRHQPRAIAAAAEYLNRYV